MRVLLAHLAVADSSVWSVWAPMQWVGRMLWYCTATHWFYSGALAHLAMAAAVDVTIPADPTEPSLLIHRSWASIDTARVWSRVYVTVERPSVCLSHRSTAGCRRVYCWAPCGQEILIGSCGRRRSAAMRVALWWEPTEEVQHRLVSMHPARDSESD